MKKLNSTRYPHLTRILGKATKIVEAKVKKSKSKRTKSSAKKARKGKKASAAMAKKLAAKKRAKSSMAYPAMKKAKLLAGYEGDYKKDLAMTLLTEAFVSELEEHDLDDGMAEVREEVRKEVVSPGCELTSSLEYTATETFGIDLDPFLPMGLVDKIEAEVNKRWAGHMTLEKLYEHDDQAAHRLVLLALGHGVSPWDDRDCEEWLESQGAERLSHLNFESASDEAWRLLEAFGKKIEENSAESAVQPQSVQASGDSVPRIYVGTYGKYNNGSIDGKWLDLNDYSSKEEFYDACKALHPDEEDPEFMFQDYEGFPERFYGESGLNDNIWDWLKLGEEDRELLEVYIDETGDADATIEDAQDHFMGTFSSEEDWAQNFLDETGGLSSDNAAYYLTISDTDARLIAQEDADARAEDMSDEEFVEWANVGDEFEAASDEQKPQVIEEAKEAFREDYANTEEKKIKDDPVGYFVDEQGMYTIEELAKQPFIQIDYEKFARDCQMNGGVSFAHKDGEVWVLHSSLETEEAQGALEDGTLEKDIDKALVELGEPTDKSLTQASVGNFFVTLAMAASLFNSGAANADPKQFNQLLDKLGPMLHKSDSSYQINTQGTKDGGTYRINLDGVTLVGSFENKDGKASHKIEVQDNKAGNSSKVLAMKLQQLLDYNPKGLD